METVICVEVADNPPTVCDRCGKNFTNVYTLRAHKKTVHDKIKSHDCPHCSNKFTTKYKLQRHIQGVHSDTRDFHCEACGCSFKTRDMLVKHSRTHSRGLGPFKCNVCEIEFKFKSGLDHHEKLKHSRVNVIEAKEINGEVFENIRNPPRDHRRPKEKCYDQQDYKDETVFIVDEIMTEELEGEEEMLDEIIYEDFEEIEEKSDGNKEEYEIVDCKLICDTCGSFFKSKSHLKRHFDRKHGDKADFRFECAQCDKRFLLNYDLQRHMVKHDPTRRLNCPHCEKKFKTKPSLDNHIKVIHETTRKDEEKQFVCGVCNRSYFHRRHLDYHMRKHTNDRRYACDKCDMIFFYSDAVKWHRIRVHDEPPLYTCSKYTHFILLIIVIIFLFLDICLRKFIHQKTFDSHLKEHDENGSLAVTCSICFKKVSEKRHLKRHMRIHKEKSFICEICFESFQEKYQLTR